MWKNHNQETKNGNEHDINLCGPPPSNHKAILAVDLTTPKSNVRVQ